MSFMPSFLTKGSQEIDLATAARYVPSLAATEAHESRSERYTYIPTIDVLRGLDKEGFKIFSVAQCKTRHPDRADFTKHMIRMRRADATPINGYVPEVVLINSHDGSSSYRMFSGIFRFICSNGMIVPESMFNDVRVMHKGNVVDNVIEGAYRVVEQFDRVTGKVEDMRAVNLDDREARALASAAIPLRFDVAEGEPLPVSPDQVLTMRRFADKGSDLWTVTNRIQENLVRGGLNTVRIGANGRRNIRASRAVTGIDGNVKLNQAILALADEMMKIKAAA